MSDDATGLENECATISHSSAKAAFGRPPPFCGPVLIFRARRVCLGSRISPDWLGLSRIIPDYLGYSQGSGRTGLIGWAGVHPM